jgi:hypothetical protein
METKERIESGYGGTAAKRGEDVGAGAIRDEGSEIAHAENTELVTGFAPLRGWANRRIRNRPQTTLALGGRTMNITEITVDGQIRLEAGDGSFQLVPLDERYIAPLFGQLLLE